MTQQRDVVRHNRHASPPPSPVRHHRHAPRIAASPHPRRCVCAGGESGWLVARADGGACEKAGSAGEASIRGARMRGSGGVDGGDGWGGVALADPAGWGWQFSSKRRFSPPTPVRLRVLACRCRGSESRVDPTPLFGRRRGPAPALGWSQARMVVRARVQAAGYWGRLMCLSFFDTYDHRVLVPAGERTRGPG